LIQLQAAGKVLWQAFPKQEEALSRREFEVLFGGSRGPGKTAAGIVKLVMGNLDVKNPKPGSADESYINHPHYRALVLRKNVSDMGDWVHKAKQIYGPLGGTLNARPLEFQFPSGAAIVISHLDDENAFEKYQGQEFTRILIEEATQIPSIELYLKVMASCRTPWRDLRPQMFLTANPGGSGHGWVRDRFVVVAEPGTPYRDSETA
jgi:hypothetical protein